MAKAISKEYLLTQLKNLDSQILSKKYLQASQLGLKKLESAETGFLASYQLTQTVGETTSFIGDKINIPKDFLVKKAEVLTCSTAGTPLAGLKKGDKYLDFIVNSKDSETDEGNTHLYIAVADLVSEMSAGNGIDITDGAVSVKAKDKSGISVTADGVAVATGDGITLSTEGAVTVNVGEGLKIDDAGKVALDFEFSVEEGDGIEVADDGKTVSVKLAEDGGILVDDDGALKIDTESLLDFETENITYTSSEWV